MTLALVLAPLLFATATATAQKAEPKSEPPPESPPASNLVFAEALGNGLLYSIDYERMVDAWNVGFRAGFSFFTYAVSSYGGSGNLTLVSAPLVASWYWGPKSHKLQLGLGATILYLGGSSDSEGTEFAGDRAGLGVAATGVIGYRFVPRDGGFSFGLGFTPLVRTSSFLAWGGANVGYAF